jgi:CubicO group peptidase (beta-lactamase class C family)
MSQVQPVRRLLLLHTLAVVLSGVVILHADDFVVSRFGDYLDALRLQAGIPGLAATLVGLTDVTWEQAFGQQDIERNVAARTDTPFQLDGLTEMVVASLALRCAESGWLRLDDRVGTFDPTSPDASATLRQLMTHTTDGPDGLRFSYRPDRLAPLAAAVSSCTDSSFRSGVAGLLDRMAMADSVPGSDVASIAPGSGEFDASALDRYGRVLGRLAVPYAVNASGRPSPSRYTATTLTPSSGLIATARDLAKFDLALKQYVVLRPETLALARTPPVDRNGQRLPHGLGWFVQTYNGESIVWQFGVADNASSSMIVTVPGRGLTLILVANSSGLARPFSLDAGDLTVSPFARLFLGIFVH